MEGLGYPANSEIASFIKASGERRTKRKKEEAMEERKKPPSKPKPVNDRPKRRSDRFTGKSVQYPSDEEEKDDDVPCEDEEMEAAAASTSTELATSKPVTRRKSPRVHDSKYKKDDVVVALIAPIDGGRKYPEPRRISEIVYTQGGGVVYSMYGDDGEYQESDIIRLHVFKDIDDDTFTAGLAKKNKNYESRRKTSSEGKVAANYSITSNYSNSYLFQYHP